MEKSQNNSSGRDFYVIEEQKLVPVNHGPQSTQTLLHHELSRPGPAISRLFSSQAVNWNVLT